MGNVMRYKLYF